jgi:hypothetical protein
MAFMAALRHCFDHSIRLLRRSSHSHYSHLVCFRAAGRHLNVTNISASASKDTFCGRYQATECAVNMLRRSTAQMRLASSSLEPGLYTRKHGVVGI